MRAGVDYVGISVSYLCHDGAGHFLFNKRSAHARDEHGRWDNGGGQLEFGNSIVENLKKEVKEEYGADVLAYQFLGYRDVLREQHGISTHWVSIDFLVRVDRAQVVNGEPHKFDEIGWFTLDALPSPLHSQFPKFLEQYSDKLPA